jgi:hypothetical protein
MLFPEIWKPIEAYASHSDRLTAIPLRRYPVGLYSRESEPERHGLINC